MRTSPPLRRHPRAAALILTLATLLLVSALVLVFFTKARLDRQIAQTGTSQVKVDLLARAAAEIVVGEVLEEIRVGSDVSQGGNGAYPKMYEPKDAADVILSKSGVNSGATDDLGTVTVRKVSAAGEPFFDKDAGTGRTLASTASTGSASRNGRAWTTSRWYTGGGSPSLGSANLPDWVLIGRRGIVANPTAAAASDPAGSDYVIGRFAFTVYDIGGLPDANVAGFGSAAAAEAGYKGVPAFADLTALGLNQLTQVDPFVDWRNRTTDSSLDLYKEWATGQERTGGSSDMRGLEIARAGHLVAALGDDAVLSRRDLLNNPHIGTAGSLLTHFSRALNKPSAIPDTVTVANPKLYDVRFPAGGTINHYRDDGTQETYDVSAGDPLLQRRFSLARIAWLTPEGPSANLATSHPQYNDGGTAAAIRACFGLAWDESNARWAYVGSTNPNATTLTPETEIKTLTQVATESREPNFFEVLRAGIVEGSLGQRTYAGSVLSGGGGWQPTLESDKDLQVIKIGANIIDCADRDNYPSILYFAPGGQPVESAGVENLPYLTGIDTAFLKTLVATSTSAKDPEDYQMTQADLVWVPTFFNPHSTDSGSDVSTPGTLSVAIAEGYLASVAIKGVDESDVDLSANPIDLAGPSLASLNTFDVPTTGFQDHPDVMRGAGMAQSLGARVPYATADTDVLCFHVFSYVGNGYASSLAKNLSGWFPQFDIRVDNLRLELRYQSPSGKMKTYAALGSYDDGAGGLSMGRAGFKSTTSQKAQTDLNSVYYSKLWDPRTKRLGPSQGWSRSRARNPVPDPDDTNDNMRYYLPFLNSAFDSNAKIKWGRWPQGGKTNAGYQNAPVGSDYVNMGDPDSTTGEARPADGWWGDGANLYRNLNDPARRPVILQRPYRSVAELGYVSRDQPWKTLSFFDETSGDKALLDLFTISDQPDMVAGYTQFATSPMEAAAAALQGSGQNSTGADTLTAPSYVADALSDVERSASGEAQSGTLRNVADFADFLGSLKGNASSQLGLIKYENEAVVRALAGMGQTRVWNLLIDVVAQTGRYPESATSLDDFVVEGERRYWLSLAIDRFTGEVLDRQLETVTD